MFINRAVLQKILGVRVYQLTCDNDSPLDELIAVLKEFTGFSEKILEESLKKQSEFQKVEEVKEQNG